MHQEILWAAVGPEQTESISDTSDLSNERDQLAGCSGCSCGAANRRRHKRGARRVAIVNLNIKTSLVGVLVALLLARGELSLAQEQAAKPMAPEAAAAVTTTTTTATTATTTTTTTTADTLGSPPHSQTAANVAPTTRPPAHENAEPMTTTPDSDETTPSVGDDLGPDSESGSGELLGRSISHSADANMPQPADQEKGSANLSVDQDGDEPLDEPPADQNALPTLPPVNMSLIDETFVKGRRGEKQTVESWRQMSNKLRKGIGAIIGSVVPMALNMSQEARISSNCSGAMLKWVLSMNQLKAWALRMLDASGKPIAGLLEGSMTLFGNYRQCLKVRAPDDDEIEFTGSFKEYFRGKYCIIQAKPWLPEKSKFYNLNAKLNSLTSRNEEEGEEQPTGEQWYDKTIFDELSDWVLAFNFVSMRFDVCVPSLCKREDIQKAVNYIMKGIDVKARVLRCEIESSSPFAAATVETGSLEIAEALHAAAAAAENQDTSNSDLYHQLKLSTFSQLGWILIPLIATVLVLIATGLSLTIGHADDKDDQARSEKIHQDQLKTSAKSKLGHTIHSLSLKRSVDSHLNVDYDQLADDKPLALYGVRLLLVLWVILVESAVNLKFEYLRELMILKDLIFWWPLQFIINSTLQYDSFILLAAFTMGYKNCLNDGINQGRALARFVVDKYVRLMPSIMLMVALVILLPLVHRGPVWNDYVATQSAVCQSTGWVNSIFLQNYLPFNQICLPQTWLLCVEFQLVLIMAPIVYYLNKNYMENFISRTHHKQPPVFGKFSPISQKPTPNSNQIFYWIRTTPGLILLACAILGSSATFYNVYSKELPPSWLYTMADPDSKALYFGEHFTKVWTHLAVFAMGLLAGVECRRAAKNVICSGGSNNYAARSNSITSADNAKHEQTSKSSSASSLPIMFAQNGTTNKKNSDNLNLAKFNTGSDYPNWHSSISIEMTSNNSTSLNESHEKSDGTKYSNNQHGNKTTRSLVSIFVEVVISLVVIVVMSVIIFSTHDWSVNDLPEPYVAGLFDSGSRFFWSLGMIWFLYMISVPKKDKSFSMLARLLGHPLMVSLGKLSFLIYIIHPFVHTAVLAIQEQPIYSNWLMLFHILLGNITLTVILAALVSLFVEMPCRNLFRRCGTSLLLVQSDFGAGSRPDTVSSITTTTTATKESNTN